MKRSLLILGLFGLLVPSIAFAASAIRGIWSGTAYSVSGTSYDHETHILMTCGGNVGTATYTYTDLEIECESTLTLESSSGNPQIGWAVWNYDDDTHSPDCIDGKVTLKTHPTYPNQVFFQWKYEDGTVDTEGWLDKTGSVVCFP